MLTDDQTDKVRLLFSLAGWTEVMRPAIENRVRETIKSLILPSSKRAEEDRDDNVLRARIDELTWILSAFDKEVEVNLHNRRVEADASALADEESPDGQILNRR